MENILLVVHLMLALSMIVVVLLQRSEGGALGIGGGGGGGMSGFMTGRSAANVLTRATAVLAGLFLLTSIALAKISGGGARDPGSVVVPTQIEQPATPAEPSAPVD
jgi:preprotein translocase subunit SecG